MLFLPKGYNYIMKDEIISVIITVFNRKSFLDKCIRSVLFQEGVSIELILVDDESTDGSSKICQSYESKYDNVKLIRQKNSGLSKSRNVGLDNAAGDYIVFLDDDDIMTPGSLRTMLDAMHTYDVDFVLGNFERVDKNGIFCSESHMPENVKNRVINTDEYWKASFDNDGYFIFIVNWAKLYKKKIWENLRFPEEYRKSEDEYLMSDILARCNTIYVTDYIVHKQTLTTNSITRSKPSMVTLLAPKSKLVTVSKLIKQKKYNYASKKWGIACGEIVSYTKSFSDKSILNELNKLYLISVDQGKQLYKYFDYNKKAKFILYRCTYPLLRLICYLFHSV